MELGGPQLRQNSQFFHLLCVPLLFDLKFPIYNKGSCQQTYEEL